MPILPLLSLSDFASLLSLLTTTHKHTNTLTFINFLEKINQNSHVLDLKKNKNNNIYNQLLLKQTQLCYKKNTWNFHRDKLERERVERQKRFIKALNRGRVWELHRLHRLFLLSLSLYLSSSSLSLSPTPFKSGTSLSLSLCLALIESYITWLTSNQSISFCFALIIIVYDH